MKHRISVVDGASSFGCGTGQSVLAAMAAAAQRCIPVGCRSGGCGVCTVRVLSGQYSVGAMSATQIDATQRAQGYVLACKLIPHTDLVIQPVGRLSQCMARSAVSASASPGLSFSRPRLSVGLVA